MTARPAPFDHAAADAVKGAQAVWTRAADGTRLRVGQLAPGDRGTVLLLQGRTEYLEKYGRTARALAAGGLATVSVDFRGQGLSERSLPDPLLGHVRAFGDYQQDVAALASYAERAGLARPWFLLAHSMGGAIGLRAVLEGLPVIAAAFSAPMWGIAMPAPLRPLAWGLGWLARRGGCHRLRTPMTTRESYVRSATPQDNALTSDPEMLAYMARQLEAVPGVELGGPTLSWLYEALAECAALSRTPAPDLPALVLLPGAETIVSVPAIRGQVARWEAATLETLPEARHEALMERPEIRGAAEERILAFFDTHRGGCRLIS